LGRESIICMTLGRSRRGSNGLGVENVRGLSRVPMPPARISAFMKIREVRC